MAGGKLATIVNRMRSMCANASEKRLQKSVTARQRESPLRVHLGASTVRL